MTINQIRKMTLLLVLTLSTGVSAKAAQPQDLADFMSPAELDQEFDFSQDDFKNMFWKMSASESRLQIVVNKAERGEAQDAQTLEAFLDGVLLYRTVVSTGKETMVKTPPSERFPEGRTYNARTPVGAFRINRRSLNHVSATWPGASMPFAQFFTGGIAIHATTPDHFSALGRRDSGGCVRLHPRDAKYMWDLVDMIGVQEAEIFVYDGSRAAHPLGRVGEVPYYASSKQSSQMIKAQK